MRYAVINKSVSLHCCFVCSIVDTKRLDILGEPTNMCECFEEEDALQICKALNEVEDYENKFSR